VRFLRYHAAVEWHVQNLGIDYTFLRPTCTSKDCSFHRFHRG